MVLGASLVPAWGTILAQGLQEKMLEWLRCAEFTCDRAALLAVQDPKTVMSVLMKLSGGSPSLAPQLNLDAFVAQARAYDAIDESELGELIKTVQTAQLTHPVPVLRAREIDRWAGSQQYQHLLQNGKTDYNSETGYPGKWRNW